jgi:hypothetical protein
MIARSTNGSTPGQVEMATNLQNVAVQDFADGATALSADAHVTMPSDWDASTFTATFLWMVNSTSTNSVVWQIAARGYTDGQSLDQAFGTAVAVSDAGSGTANTVQKSAASSAVTAAGSAAAGGDLHLRIFRDPAHASDNLAATARLLGVVITYGRT